MNGCSCRQGCHFLTSLQEIKRDWNAGERDSFPIKHYCSLQRCHHRVMAFLIASKIHPIEQIDDWSKQYLKEALIPFGYRVPKDLKLKMGQISRRSTVDKHVACIYKPAFDLAIALQELQLPALLLYEVQCAVAEPFSNMIDFRLLWVIATTAKHYIEKIICGNCKFGIKSIFLIPCRHVFCNECAVRAMKTKKCWQCCEPVKRSVFDYTTMQKSHVYQKTTFRYAFMDDQ